METNGENRFASQGVSIAQMMYASKYKSHKIALFNSMKKSNIAPISPVCMRQRFLYRYPETQLAETTKQPEQDLLSQSPIYPPLTTGLSGPGLPMSGDGSFNQNKGQTWTQKTWKKRSLPKTPTASPGSLKSQPGRPA